MQPNKNSLEFSGLIEIIDSFNSKVWEVAKAIGSTHEMFEELKKVWSQMVQNLREVLAREKSFRRRDFDRSLQGILDFQKERELQVRFTLNQYIESQKEFSKRLKVIVSEAEKGRVEGNGKLIQGSVKSFSKLKEEFEAREIGLNTTLTTFKEQQRLIARTFDGLFKTKGLSPKDFKESVSELLKNLNGREEGKEEIDKFSVAA